MIVRHHGQLEIFLEQLVQELVMLVTVQVSEYPAAMPAASNTGVNGWFSFVMDAAGSASVNVDAVTDFPEFIEATIYSDCNGNVASADDLQAGTYVVNVVQTVPEIGDVDFSVSVDISILGCTDSVLQIMQLQQ